MRYKQIAISAAITTLTICSILFQPSKVKGAEETFIATIVSTNGPVSLKMSLDAKPDKVTKTLALHTRLFAGELVRAEPGVTLNLLVGRHPITLKGTRNGPSNWYTIPNAYVPQLPPALQKIRKSFVLGGAERPGSNDPHLGPRAPSPLGAICKPSVILRWQGPVEGDHLHLRIREFASDHTIYESDLLNTIQEFKVPKATLKSGIWYIWSVMVVDSNGIAQKCGGLLCRLRHAECEKLQVREQEANRLRHLKPSNPIPNLLMARAYEDLGLFKEALDSYKAALRQSPLNKNENTDMQMLDKVLAGSK